MESKEEEEDEDILKKANLLTGKTMRTGGMNDELVCLVHSVVCRRRRCPVDRRR